MPYDAKVRHVASLGSILLGCAVVSVPLHAAAEPWQNWFDDPFFQVRDGMPGCPQPAGPLTDKRGRREQAHRRAEKGTTCWLAGTCERPKAYLYDPDIAESVRRRFRQNRDFEGSSLWITVQGRVVYIEGCVDRSVAPASLEALVWQVPHVERAIAIVRAGTNGPVPYRTLPRQP